MISVLFESLLKIKGKSGDYIFLNRLSCSKFNFQNLVLKSWWSVDEGGGSKKKGGAWYLMVSQRGHTGLGDFEGTVEQIRRKHVMPFLAYWSWHEPMMQVNNALLTDAPPRPGHQATTFRCIFSFHTKFAAWSWRHHLLHHMPFLVSSISLSKGLFPLFLLCL